MVWGVAAAVIVVLVLLQVRWTRRHRARRASLHQDASGSWVWVDFDGSERRADIHPEKPGGAWYSEPSRSDGGDNDGGGGGDSDGGGGGGD